METPEASLAEAPFPFIGHAQAPPDTISCTVTRRQAHSTEEYTLSTFIVLVPGMPKDAIRTTQASETDTGVNSCV